MEYKAETHRHKFVLDILTDKLGEEAILLQLVRIGIVHCNYVFHKVNGTIAVFKRTDGKTFLRPRKEVRIIGKENGKPLLACVSVQGAVKEIKGDELLVDLRDLTSATRTRQQVFNHPFNCTFKVIISYVGDIDCGVAISYFGCSLKKFIQCIF